MKIKVCYIMSFIDFSQQFVDLDNHIDTNKYDVNYVFLGAEKPALYEIFKARGREVFFVEYCGKKNLPAAIARLYKIFGGLKPDILHTHMVDASLVALIAGKMRGIKKRVQVRHHSIENHVCYPHGVYYDRLNNRLSTKIVAISSIVAEVLIKREKVEEKKIKIIEHGFDFDNYFPLTATVVESKKLYDLDGHYPVIGVISRFTRWKGVQYIVPAFRELLRKYPNAKLILANATGDYSREILDLLKDIDKKNYVLIGFEKEILALYRTFDVFVHVPIDREFEAFGQTYVEALAMEVPSVFTLSGVANDFIENGRNALVVPYRNSAAIQKAIETILEDKELREKIRDMGKRDVIDRFHIKKMVRELDLLYSQL